MSIATLLSIKNCAHRDTAREKGYTDFLTWFVSSSLASNAGIRELQAYSPIGIQGPQSLVVLHPVQKSRLSFISQFGDHKFLPPASLYLLEARIFYLMFLLLLVLFFKCWLQFVLVLSLVRRRLPCAVPRWVQIWAKFCWDFFPSSSFLSPGEDDLSWPSSYSVFKKQVFNTEKQMYLFREQKQIMIWQKTVLHTQNFTATLCI